MPLPLKLSKKKFKRTNTLVAIFFFFIQVYVYLLQQKGEKDRRIFLMYLLRNKYTSETNSKINIRPQSVESATLDMYRSIELFLREIFKLICEIFGWGLISELRMTWLYSNVFYIISFVYDPHSVGNMTKHLVWNWSQLHSMAIDFVNLITDLHDFFVNLKG